MAKYKQVKRGIMDTATYENELMIESPQKCECCNGSGTLTTHISLVNLLDIMEATSGVRNKINFIKAIRERWELPLYDAKKLAESAIDFKKNAIIAINKNQ